MTTIDRILSLENPFTEAQTNWLQSLSLSLKKDIVQLIAHAGSGHIGGSLSCLDVLIMLYATANLSPKNMTAEDRDRLIVSMGHVSPALYSVLAEFGYVDKAEMFMQYRSKEGVYEGHPNNCAPGVEWCNGCLGQGLSQGVGVALAQRLRGNSGTRVYVLMGDGEQSKGQLQEAMELAYKYGLSNLTAIVDLNGQQSSGSTSAVLAVPIADRYRAAGWNVIEMNGHDYEAIRRALWSASHSEQPTCLLAHTIMGHGVPEIENDWHYHGKCLSTQQVQTAVSNFDEQLAKLPPIRLPVRTWCGVEATRPTDSLSPLNGCDGRRQYAADAVIDGRKTCAATLLEFADNNPAGNFCIVDCDLASGLGLDKIAATHPEQLIECGIQEHNAVSVAGGLAASGVNTFFMDFGVFAMAEPFNQLRVLDQNHVPLKVIASHCGVDVGQDGKSHQFIDTIALANALLGFDLILPADPNQTDQALRYLAKLNHGGILATPRSNLPVLTDDRGEPIFGNLYRYEYGKADWIRRGKNAVIIAYGVMIGKALEASKLLKGDGIDCGVLNISSPKRLDAEQLSLAIGTGHVIVAEDHNRSNGLGTMIASFIAERGLSCRFRCLGIERYGISASPAMQFVLQKLTPQDLAQSVKETM